MLSTYYVPGTVRCLTYTGKMKYDLKCVPWYHKGMKLSSSSSLFCCVIMATASTFLNLKELICKILTGLALCGYWAFSVR